MAQTNVRSSDVVIVGGGPAGISTALELAKCRRLRIDLMEYEPELGGIPQSAHLFFGMRDQKRLLTGPAYARGLVRRIEKTPVTVHTRSTVVGIEPDANGGSHRVFVAASGALTCYRCRFVVLATGCYEASRESRLIPGSRPAGIMTTGTLQKLVNLQRLVPGRRAVICGSEHVALSAALTLHRAGVRIQALVEPDRWLHTYPAVARAFARRLRFPIYPRTTVQDIFGNDRVRGVALHQPDGKGRFQVPCDTVIVTGRFRPDAALIFQTGIGEDPLTGGPVVDQDLMTTMPGIYAAGNILRGANMHDLCALEGRQVARRIVGHMSGHRPADRSCVSIRPAGAIRFVVPQNFSPDRIGSLRPSLFRAGVSFQVDRTLHRVWVAATSGGRTIWQCRYRRLMANTAVPLPVERFDWRQVDPNRGIRLDCQPDAP